MNIITTPRELMDCGRWLRACGLLGINEWAVAEGLMDGDDEIRIGREQAEQIGLLPATTISANTLNIGDSVRDAKWGGTYTGTIVNVEDGSVFVQWHDSCVEDQLDPDGITPAPDVPRPDEAGFRPLTFVRP